MVLGLETGPQVQASMRHAVSRAKVLCEQMFNDFQHFLFSFRSEALSDFLPASAPTSDEDIEFRCQDQVDC